jgi:homoserine acetyltransferase
MPLPPPPPIYIPPSISAPMQQIQMPSTKCNLSTEEYLKKLRDNLVLRHDAESFLIILEKEIDEFNIKLANLQFLNSNTPNLSNQQHNVETNTKMLNLIIEMNIRETQRAETLRNILNLSRKEYNILLCLHILSPEVFF